MSGQSILIQKEIIIGLNMLKLPFLVVKTEFHSQIELLKAMFLMDTFTLQTNLTRIFQVNYKVNLITQVLQI
jgi:hypothetical protein